MVIPMALNEITMVMALITQPMEMEQFLELQRPKHHVQFAKVHMIIYSDAPSYCSTFLRKMLGIHSYLTQFAKRVYQQILK